MKTVLIIGNGFDLNLHRKTSYRSFWESPQCPKNYPAPLIHHLNQKWPDGSDAVKWYDLENEFLNYVKSIHGSRYEMRSYDIITPAEQKMLLRHREIDGAYLGLFGDSIDVIKSLSEKQLIWIDRGSIIHADQYDYDEFKLNAVERDIKALSLIKEKLCEYLMTLSDTTDMDSSVALATLRAITEKKESGEDVSVYTFNYTQLPFGYEEDLKPQYIHGSCREGNIIVGTKDSRELGSQYDFLQKSFDPTFHTPPVVYDLLFADEVVFFGHSLGMNDSQYLKPFFMQQTNINNPKRKHITVFTKDDKSVIEIKRAIQDMTDYNLSLLNSINDVEIIKTDGITTNHRGFSKFLDRYVSDANLKRSLLQGLKD